MNSKPDIPAVPTGQARDNIAYIRQMLGEMRGVAHNEGAEMLRYLIEMAYIEAGDIQAGIRPLSARRQRDETSRISVKSSGKV